MADNIWDNSDGDNDGNVAANWSLGNVPTTGDVAVFDSATTSANCTFSGNISCDGMRFDNAYAGTVDAATHNITLGTSGLDCTSGGSAILDLGSGTWTCSGDWDDADIGTKTPGTSTVVLDGTSKNLISLIGKDFYNLTIDGTITTSLTGSSNSTTTNVLTVNVSKQLSVIRNVYAKTINVNGTITIASARSLSVTDNGTVTVGSSGSVTGDGTLSTANAATATIDNSAGGTWDPVTTSPYNGYLTINAGTYGGTFDIDNAAGSARTVTLGGTVTFTGNVSLDAVGSGDLSWDSADYNMTFQGSLTMGEAAAGEVIWTKGTGTITFSGTNNQTITTPASWTQVLDHITIDKSLGGVKLVNDLYANSLTVTDGDLDLNRYDLYCAGAFSVAAGARFYSFDGNFDDMQDGKIVLQNASLLTLTGSGVGTELSIYSLDFDAASGVTYAITYCDVQSSDGTGAGSPIDGSGTGNIDSGSNTGWTFTAAAVSRQLLLLGVGT